MAKFRNILFVTGRKGYVNTFFDKYDPNKGLFESYCPLEISKDNVMPRNLGEMLSKQLKTSNLRKKVWGACKDISPKPYEFEIYSGKFILRFETNEAPTQFLNSLIERYPYLSFELGCLNVKEKSYTTRWCVTELHDAGNIAYYDSKVNNTDIDLNVTFGCHI